MSFNFKTERMKTIYYLIFSIGLILCSCQKEEELTPSLIDKDRTAELIDMSKPLVKKWKDSYNVSILHRFNDTLDFKFGLWINGTKDLWSNLAISKVSDADADQTLALLDDFILKYFKDTIVTPDGRTVYPDFKKKYFPKRILLVDTLENQTTTIPDNILIDLDNKPGKTLRAVFNGYEQMISLSIRYLPTAAEDVKRDIRDEILYDMMANMFERHDLYSQLSDEFYVLQKDLYGKDVNEKAAIEKPAYLTYLQKKGTVWMQITDTTIYSPSWYVEKGFVMLKKTPNSGGSTFIKRLNKNKQLTFPYKNLDVRSMLQVIICDLKEKETSSLKAVDPVRDYYLKSPLLKKRMKLLINQLYEWGVDVFAINPEMKEFYKD